MKINLELTSSDYREWRQHPASKVVLKYLEDFAESLDQEAVRYLYGAETTNEKFLGELVGRAKICRELADLPFEAIEQFYGVEQNDA